jgi:hypothetical protein
MLRYTLTMAFLHLKKPFAEDAIANEIELTKLEINRLETEISSLDADLPSGAYLSSYTSKGDMATVATGENRRYKYFCLAHKDKILNGISGKVKRLHIGRAPEPKLRDAINQIELMEIREAKKKALLRHEERLSALLEGNWHIVDGVKEQGKLTQPT